MWRILWEFRVAPENHALFEQLYGPKGDWAQLFGRSAEFRGTTLLRDPAVSGRYVTIDTWSNAEGFNRFTEDFAAEYKALDLRYEELTEYEMKIGAFESL